MSDASESEFWNFTLSFYARPGVSPACIALQDRHGRDVNILLFACWVGLSGRGRLAKADLDRAEAVNGPWRRSAIEKLRAARRALKEEDRTGPIAMLYEHAKALELAAEKIAQLRLQSLAPAAAVRSAGERAADAAASLALYLPDAEAKAAAAPIFAAIEAAAAL
jgi:uncharacterized protein (TIGR02444 family)